MAASTVATIRQLLEAVLAELDDPELRYRQRTALQLLALIEVRAEATQVALEQADLDPEVLDRLQRLGYLD